MATTTTRSPGSSTGSVGRLAFTHGAGRGASRVELLQHIADTGSISAAARTLGLSYKAAWEAVEGMNRLSDTPLVVGAPGGRRGGGSRLTDHGRRVLTVYGQMERRYQEFLDSLGRGLDDFDRFYRLVRTTHMKTSARNQFLGTVTSLKHDTPNVEVVADIGAGDEITAVVSRESVERLGIEVGREVCALVKAPWVVVARDPGLRTSARNRLCGVVRHCQEGALSAEVVIELSSGRQVAAILTGESLRQLGLAVGVRACALIKATHVILAVSD
jgi:molybdate transport system regulatory protein